MYNHYMLYLFSKRGFLEECDKEENV